MRCVTATSTRAAGYFALPAIVQQTDKLQLATREDARTFNAALPCGARLLDVQHDGRFIVGTFRLTDRPGQSCQTSGALVRVAFVILDRHFTEWRQLPDTPGATPGPSKPEDPEYASAARRGRRRGGLVDSRSRATGRPGGGSTARRSRAHSDV